MEYQQPPPNNYQFSPQNQIPPPPFQYSVSRPPYGNYGRREESSDFMDMDSGMSLDEQTDESSSSYSDSSSSDEDKGSKDGYGEKDSPKGKSDENSGKGSDVPKNCDGCGSEEGKASYSSGSDSGSMGSSGGKAGCGDDDELMMFKQMMQIQIMLSNLKSATQQQQPPPPQSVWPSNMMNRGQVPMFPAGYMAMSTPSQMNPSSPSVPCSRPMPGNMMMMPKMSDSFFPQPRPSFMQRPMNPGGSFGMMMMSDPYQNPHPDHRRSMNQQPQSPCSQQDSSRFDAMRDRSLPKYSEGAEEKDEMRGRGTASSTPKPEQVSEPPKTLHVVHHMLPYKKPGRPTYPGRNSVSMGSLYGNIPEPDPEVMTPPKMTSEKPKIVTEAKVKPSRDSNGPKKSQQVPKSPHPAAPSKHMDTNQINIEFPVRTLNGIMADSLSDYPPPFDASSYGMIDLQHQPEYLDPESEILSHHHRRRNDQHSDYGESSTRHKVKKKHRPMNNLDIKKLVMEETKKQLLKSSDNETNESKQSDSKKVHSDDVHPDFLFL